MLSVLVIIGCTQGRGDRCQRNTDCASDLCCLYIGAFSASQVAAGGTCQPGIVSPVTFVCTTTDIDAAVAPPADAMIDATIDTLPIDGP